MRIPKFPGLTVATLALLAAAAPVGAQAVIDSPKGAIEVIGLRQWTVRMLEDSVAAKAPGESLRSHACAAILQEKLGFPAAAVSEESMQLAPDAEPTTTILITVVEPQDSARVQLRRMDGRRGAGPWTWVALEKAASDSTRLRINEVLFAMQFYGLYRAAPDSAAARVRRFVPRALPAAQEIWREVARLAGPGELATAIRATRSDTSWGHRVLAVSVLANFATRDAAWHALAAAMRDPDERVRNAAGMILGRLAEREPRRIDWRPARADLRALLGGTNVWEYRTLLDVLGRTQVSPALAGTLLRDNTHLLLAHLEARAPQAHEPALAATRRLSGRPAMSRDEAVAWVAAF
ncbi:MAG TPA: hypothetical protein VGE02_12810 [Gemmatimonadales bacterium]